MNTNDLLELAQEVGVSKDTSVKDLLGLQSEIPDMIYQINIGKYRLAITFGGHKPPIIEKFRGNIYTLNIQDDDSHAQFHWKGEWARELITKQLNLFMPTIQKFMIDALIDNLN
jgi:hypothetical protein